MAKREELASMIIGDETDNQRLSLLVNSTASAELDPDTAGSPDQVRDDLLKKRPLKQLRFIQA
jgi:hypothetical protein